MTVIEEVTSSELGTRTGEDSTYMSEKDKIDSGKTYEDVTKLTMAKCMMMLLR